VAKKRKRAKQYERLEKRERVGIDWGCWDRESNKKEF
jgi:hypothetical protein